MSGVFRKGDLVAYVASPFISVFLYSIIGEIFTRVGVFCSWISVGVAALLVAVVLVLIFKTAHHLLEGRQIGKHEKANNIVTPKTTKRDYLIFALYPFMGTVLYSPFILKAYIRLIPLQHYSIICIMWILSKALWIPVNGHSLM